MTQNLLDTTTIFLNSTKSELNLSSNAKNYTEAFSNGKSFNDILSNANNKTAKNSKFNLNISNKTNSNTLNNKNSQNFDSSKNSVSDQRDVSPKNGTNKLTQNSQNSSKQDKTVVSDNEKNNNSSLNNSEVNESKTKKLSEIDSNADNTDNENLLTEKTNDVISMANSVNLVDFTEKIDDFADIDTLNQLLIDDNMQEESVQADFYINAFYQSTLDSLNDSETVIQSVDLNSQLVNELDGFVSQSEVESSVQTNDVLLNNIDVDAVKTLDIDDTNNDLIDKNNISSNLVNTTEKDTTTTTQNVEIKDKFLSSSTKAQNANIVSQGKDALSTVNNSQELSNEDNTVNNDVLVNVSDDVIQQEAQPVINEQNENKLSFREIMQKAGLDEAKLEALNLNVTDVSNGESDFGGNLGQNSAQDDIVRLSLETQGKKDLNASVQNKDFSKMIDMKQNVEEQPSEISKNDILAQINNKMQAQNINGTKKITLQLTPESLGKITIEIMKGKDGLQAKMLTDNYQVKDMLEKNIDGLKSTLANQGVTVNNVSVKVASASESSSEFSFGRDNFEGENSQQQNFAGTGERRGENNSQYTKASNPELEMSDDETLTDNSTSEEIATEAEILENNLSKSENEKILVGAGNVDIEV